MEGLDSETDISFAACVHQLSLSDTLDEFDGFGGKGHYGVIGHDGAIYDYDSKGDDGDEVNVDEVKIGDLEVEGEIVHLACHHLQYASLFGLTFAIFIHDLTK